MAIWLGSVLLTDARFTYRRKRPWPFLLHGHVPGRNSSGAQCGPVVLRFATLLRFPQHANVCQGTMGGGGFGQNPVPAATYIAALAHSGRIWHTQRSFAPHGRWTWAIRWLGPWGSHKEVDRWSVTCFRAGRGAAMRERERERVSDVRNPFCQRHQKCPARAM